MKILVCVDGSPASLAAVAHAVGLIREGLLASLVLANVQERANLYEIVVAHDPEVSRQAARGAGAHALEAAEALCEQAGVAFESEVAAGQPAHALLDIAEDHACDMLLLGQAGNTPGAVARMLMHDAHMPVTLVRAQEVEASADADTAGEPAPA